MHVRIKCCSKRSEASTGDRCPSAGEGAGRWGHREYERLQHRTSIAAGPQSKPRKDQLYGLVLFGFSGMTNRYVPRRFTPRSEEHTSELQSRENLVCRLLLEKKKKQDK